MRQKQVPIPVPLIEREPEEIRRELAAFFGVGLDAVRVTKVSLGQGRNVAYIRTIWPERAWRTNEKRRD